MNNKDVYPMSFFTSKGISAVAVKDAANGCNGRAYLIRVSSKGRWGLIESQFRRNPKAYK